MSQYNESEKTLEDKLSDVVHFKIVLKDNSYTDLVKTSLESAYPGMNIKTTKMFIFGNANKELYESVFSAQLEIDMKKHERSNVKDQPYWKETKKAQVPEIVKDYVSSIFVPKPVTLF